MRADMSVAFQKNIGGEELSALRKILCTNIF